VALPAPPTLLQAFEKTLFSGNPYLRPYLTWYQYFYAMTHGTTDKWRRISVRCEDVSSDLRADDAYFTMDLVNYTNGVIDTTWTTDDYNKVWLEVGTFLQSYAQHMSSNGKFTEGHAYIMQFNPDWIIDDPKSSPFVPSGPPENSTQFAWPGQAGTSWSAGQVAMSVTELTPMRAHWGRFYLPFPAPGNFQASQQFDPTFVDQVATAVHLMYDNLSAAELYPVVTQTRHKGVSDQSLLQVTGVQVDSNPDVIRRRRKWATAYKKVLPVQS